MKIFFFKKKTVFRFTRHADVRECAHCDILKKQGFLQKVPKNGVFPCTRILRGCSNKETHLAFSGPFYIGLNPPIFALFGPPPKPPKCVTVYSVSHKNIFSAKILFFCLQRKKYIFFPVEKKIFFFSTCPSHTLRFRKINLYFFL